jgi:hypothetical protein
MESSWSGSFTTALGNLRRTKNCEWATWALNDLPAGLAALWMTEKGWWLGIKLMARLRWGLKEEMVAGDGIEPPTQGFSVLCSTN